jgi:hypothetical protein
MASGYIISNYVYFYLWRQSRRKLSGYVFLILCRPPGSRSGMDWWPHGARLGHSAKNDLSMEVLRDFCTRETFLQSVPVLFTCLCFFRRDNECHHVCRKHETSPKNQCSETWQWFNYNLSTKQWQEASLALAFVCFLKFGGKRGMVVLWRRKIER